MLTRREVVRLVLAFLLTLPLVATRLYASDEIEYFAWLRSLAFDRDVDFENEYQYFYDAGVSASPEFHETFLERTTEIGRRINYATPGPAVLWSPFYLAGHVVALITGAPADGFSKPYIAAVAYGSACYGFAAILLSAAIARRLLGHGLTAALCVAAGTPLIFYTYVAPGFGHATSAFAVALFVWVWLRVRERWTPAGAIALGLSCGLMGIVREQDLFLAVGPAIDFLVWFFAGSSSPGRSLARSAVTALAGIAAFLAAYSPLLFAYLALNGHIGQTESAERKMNWASPHAPGVLFDLEHGLLAWTPLVLVAIAGLVLLRFRGPRTDGEPAGTVRDVPWIGGLMLLMFAAQVYTSGSVGSWTVAGSFGQRRFIALTPLLVVGVSAVFVHVRTALSRRLVVAAMVLCMWWNLGLMAQFGLNRMDRQRLTLAENARVTFLELPFEAPGLAWRYLTNRSSLYNLPRQ